VSTSLRELAGELRIFHQALLQARRQEYEQERGPISGPPQLFHLVVHDPAFAWLRPLSALMADLDELLEAEAPATDEEQGAVRQELEHLLSPAGDELWAGVTRFMQADFDVATAYAALRQLLLGLPRPAPLDEAAALHARHRWAEVRQHRGARPKLPKLQ
jgi:hypothetical protein